jgi:hypothetical protein
VRPRHWARSVAGWSAVSLAGLAAGALALWLYSRAPGAEALSVPVPVSGGPDPLAHVVVARGFLSLCSEIAVGPSGEVGPRVIDRREFLPPAATFRTMTLPGLEVRSGRIGPDRLGAPPVTVWSVTASLLLPAILLTLASLGALRAWLRLGRTPRVGADLQVSGPPPGSRRDFVRRAALEWGFMATGATAVLLALGWGMTRSESAPGLPFPILTWGRHDVGLILGRGELAVCHHFSIPPAGPSLRVDPPTPSVPLLWGGRVTVPGVDIRYDQYAQAGAPLVWDVRVSLLVPAALAVLAALLLVRALRRRHALPASL